MWCFRLTILYALSFHIKDISTISITNKNVLCSPPDSMTLQLTFDEPFNGVVYISNTPIENNCRILGDGSTSVELQIPLQHTQDHSDKRYCGVILTQDESYAVDVLISERQDLITNDLELVQVKCQFQGSPTLKTLDVLMRYPDNLVADPRVVKDDAVQVIGDYIPLISMVMRKGHGDIGETLEEAFLGQEISLDVSYTPEGFSVVVFNCSAVDNTEPINSIQFVNEDGCMLEKDGVSINDLKHHTDQEGIAHIMIPLIGFRFRKSDYVSFQCYTRACLQPCVLRQCSELVDISDSKTTAPAITPPVEIATTPITTTLPAFRAVNYAVELTATLLRTAIQSFFGIESSSVTEEATTRVMMTDPPTTPVPTPPTTVPVVTSPETIPPIMLETTVKMPAETSASSTTAAIADAPTTTSTEEDELDEPDTPPPSAPSETVVTPEVLPAEEAIKVESGGAVPPTEDQIKTLNETIPSEKVFSTTEEPVDQVTTVPEIPGMDGFVTAFAPIATTTEVELNIFETNEDTDTETDTNEAEGIALGIPTDETEETGETMETDENEKPGEAPTDETVETEETKETGDNEEEPGDTPTDETEETGETKETEENEEEPADTPTNETEETGGTTETGETEEEPGIPFGSPTFETGTEEGTGTEGGTDEEGDSPTLTTETDTAETGEEGTDEEGDSPTLTTETDTTETGEEEPIPPPPENPTEETAEDTTDATFAIGEKSSKKSQATFDSYQGTRNVFEERRKTDGVQTGSTAATLLAENEESDISPPSNGYPVAQSLTTDERNPKTILDRSAEELIEAGDRNSSGGVERFWFTTLFNDTYGEAKNNVALLSTAIRMRERPIEHDSPYISAESSASSSEWGGKVTASTLAGAVVVLVIIVVALTAILVKLTRRTRTYNLSTIAGV